MPRMTKAELEEENDLLRSKLEKIEREVQDALGYDDDDEGEENDDDEDNR
jgi:hypothetical protein